MKFSVGNRVKLLVDIEPATKGMIGNIIDTLEPNMPYPYCVEFENNPEIYCYEQELELCPLTSEERIKSLEERVEDFESTLQAIKVLL